MNILVTGGAGFIGSHVVDSYISDGHKVVILDNLSTGNEKNINDQAIFYKGDILDDNVESIIAKENIEIINHHAAQIDVRRSVSDPRFDCKVNIEGSLNLFQAAVKNKVKKVVFASTGGAIYGEQEYFPADEAHPLNPISPYGISKLSVEKYLYYYLLNYQIPYTALRYANIYGMRQNPHGEAGVVAIFSKKIVNNEISTINGDGEQTRDYTFVLDVAAANLLALNDDMTGCFNVGTGKETSVNELYKGLCDAAGHDSSPRYGEAKPGEQKRSLLSNKKINSMYGWEPKYSLDEGLRKTVEFFLNAKS